MKISVCVEALYGQRLLEGIDDTARAGLHAIEFWGWADKDIGRSNTGPRHAAYR